MPREKMKISDRAKIFAPFDALKGFREMLNDKEILKQDKIILSEDQIESLNKKINSIKVLSLVKIKYYNIDKYETLIGVLNEINHTYKYIKIVKNIIYIKDIIDISIIEENTL